ncbi:MAG: TlpA family protein disulfide reductase [Burkholderiales bacterium]|nr:TlpA family protein disulfide reductase [Burkholderiales bacterium]OJX05234.1 MAG: hypothetical protein BGO72_13430 [Burkholderiales bacterium 70-64]
MRRRELIRLAGAALLAGAGAPARAEAGGVPALGTAIRLPPVRLLDGRELAPGYWRGKVVVIELWASWCPFCRKQNPEIDRLHRAHSAEGLEVLALSIDRDERDARRYMQEHGYVFHAAMFDARWQAAIGRPRGLPIVWVIGRGGRLEQLEIGEMFPEDVQALARWRSTT